MELYVQWSVIEMKQKNLFKPASILQKDLEVLAKQVVDEQEYAAIVEEISKGCETKQIIVAPDGESAIISVTGDKVCEPGTYSVDSAGNRESVDYPAELIASYNEKLNPTTLIGSLYHFFVHCLTFSSNAHV